ncbi:RagB/SusD family nutrient uptake outer membrane protein [Dawidia soli]|uniref:RagB/SusD family nutrient uptake outer membrane protein n=1 Tax=Dawidia soli TaxID=2782352 RepID=A0AAP2GJ38_9BACT|nr:RagB/SusD family nutrient uptake outer membrane protein [Dawidia soli]MBT1688986.1 RagB/SusD family nutrient uptake outer membrane protein [Dawidia soli]
MKKILYFALLLVVATACDVLDVKPTDSISADDAFQDKNGIEKGVQGAYTAFQNLGYYGRTYLLFSDLASDNMFHPAEATASEYAQVDNNNILPENGSIDGIWTSAYQGINYANNVILKVPAIADMSDEEKAQALGELRFVRALNHFNLLNFFGPIPIKLTPTVGSAGVDAPRSGADAVYEQIIADLIYAEENLAVSSQKARASRHAATALLARVYLYKGDYALASTKALEVINSKAYTLVKDYDKVFVDQSSESIFEIDFTVTNRNRMAEYTFPTLLKGRREAAPPAEMLAAYEEADTLRKKASIRDTLNISYAAKYKDLATGADNIIVLRLAEMFLIRAEAEARSEGIIDTVKLNLNKVRHRAKLEDTEAETYTALLRAIEHERRIELAFEGHRWFDLVRTNRALEVLPLVKDVDQTLFPIPLEEILTNRHPDMEQNHGY